MRESVLDAFAEKGFLPPKEVAHWRAPGREDFPQPQTGEVVSFLAFHERGLGYPAHWFLRGLLNEWGLELQHLNPTGVLHISLALSPCARPSLGWSRTWTFSSGCSLGELC